MKAIFYYNTKIGRIGIAEEDRAITDLFFSTETPPAADRIEETSLIREAGKQLEEYLNGKRTAFDLSLAPKGTEFQRRDWQELQKIPYGKTATYGEIAKALGIPKGARAVGLANNRNPISIFIPCHRIIGSNGKLVGYGGGMDLKKALLDLEGCTYRD